MSEDGVKDEGTVDEGTGKDGAGEGKGADGKGSVDQGAKDTSALVAEKIAYRRRAQEAEAERDTLQAELAKREELIAELQGKVGKFELQERRTALVREELGKIPDGKRVKDEGLLWKFAGRLENGETLEAEVKALVGDLLEDVPTTKLATGAQIPGVAPGEVRVDLSDAGALRAAYLANPAGVAEAVRSTLASGAGGGGNGGLPAVKKVG